jgi:hypothetical protein
LIEVEKVAASFGVINVSNAAYTVPPIETPKTARPVPTPPTPVAPIRHTINPARIQQPVQHPQAKKRLQYEQVSLMKDHHLIMCASN